LKDDGVSGLPKDSFPLDSYFPEVVLVVEGEARRVADEPADGVRVVAAPGSGDDEIVALVRRGAADPGADQVVVTADRELRARCEAAGAQVAGPRWLLGCLKRPS
jgi:uncharacterized protein YaiI (UPF0178 family)